MVCWPLAWPELLLDAQHVAHVRAHPNFDLKTLLAHRATADVALVKLAAPLVSATPAALDARDLRVAPGDAFTVAGSGVAVRGEGKSGGTVRAAELVATGQPGTLQIRAEFAQSRSKAICGL